MTGKEIIASLIGKAVTGLFILGLGVGALYLAPGLGTLLGEFEANWTAARQDAVAEHTQAIAEAEALPQRETFASQRAVEIEADIARRQVAAVDNSQVVQRVGANIADFGCGMGLLGAVLSPDQPASDLVQLCGVGDEIRRSMVDDYSEALTDGRTDSMTEMMDAYRRSQERRE